MTSDRRTGGPGGSEFELLGEEQVYEGWLSVALPRFRAPDGTEITRIAVRHPGAVSVVPLLDDGETVLMVRQFRPALNRYLLEIPAGKRDVPGEEPEATARRELAEEVGVLPGRLDRLCGFYNSPGFCDEHQFVFLARGLKTVGKDSQTVEEHFMTVEEIKLRDFPQLLAAGVVSDAKSIIGLMLTRDFLAQG